MPFFLHLPIRLIEVFSGWCKRRFRLKAAKFGNKRDAESMFAVKLNRLSSPDHHSFVESPGSRSRRHNIDIKFPSYSISIINHGDVERETRFERRGEREEGEKEKNGTCCAIGLRARMGCFAIGEIASN